jgi:hypothetical protein
MITAFLFSRRAPVVPDDDRHPPAPAPDRPAGPPAVRDARPPATGDLTVKATHALALGLALVGLALFISARADWTFGPDPRVSVAFAQSAFAPSVKGASR